MSLTTLATFCSSLLVAGLFHLEECSQDSSMLYHMSKFPSFLKAEYYSIVWTCLILFILSSVNGHLVCFQLLALLNNAAMNMGVQISAQVSVLNSFGHIRRTEIATSYGKSLFTFFEELPYCFPL